MGRLKRSVVFASLVFVTAASTALNAQAPSTAPKANGANEIPELSSPELLNQAGQAIDANHLPAAQALLDQVRQKDASEPGLWAAYALLSLQQKDSATAVLDFEKELALHPAAIQVYDPLVGTLLQLKRRPEAMHTLDAWSAAVPSDPRPVEVKVSLLLDEGDAPMALKAAHEGLAHLPSGAASDPQLQYFVGNAELQAGEKAAGARRLVALLSATDEPSLRNSIAYSLADAGLELPVAEAAERGVLEQLSLQSEGWSLGSGPQPLRAGTPLLVAAWDTMGWILFREGKTAEADPFVRASWRNQLQATVGEHLSEIEGARGQQAAARADLQLAIAAAKAAREQTGAARAALAAMESRLQTTGQAYKGSPALDASAALQRLRTFSLGTAGGRSGSAVYGVLISRGRINGSTPAAAGQQAWPGLNALLAHADLSALFPAPGTFVQLVHLATVACTPKGCELMLQP